MVLPQQSPGLWLLSGPKREAFLGKHLVLGGRGRLVLALRPQGPGTPRGPGAPARPGLSSRLPLSRMCFSTAEPPRAQPSLGAGDAGCAPSPGGRAGSPWGSRAMRGTPGTWHLVTATLLPPGRNRQQRVNQPWCTPLRGPQCSQPVPSSRQPRPGAVGVLLPPTSHQHNYGSVVPPTCGRAGTAAEQLGQAGGRRSPRGMAEQMPLDKPPRMWRGTKLVAARSRGRIRSPVPGSVPSPARNSPREWGRREPGDDAPASPPESSFPAEALQPQRTNER